MGIDIEQALTDAEIIDVDESWFLVKRLPNAVFSIQEPLHQEGVISFLILGDERAALLDTGLGIKDISNVVHQLTDLDVIVINSHTHFDHVGDNHRFDEIYVYDHPNALKWLTNGHSNEDLTFDTRAEAFPQGYPDGFDPDDYMIPPVSVDIINWIHDGDVIDIGNRKLEVMHTPGHSVDSVMLLDRRNRSLFTGDTFCPGRLFAFISEDWGGSDLATYEKTMHEVAKLVPNLDYLYCSHGEALVDPSILPMVADAFSEVNRGDAKFAFQELYGEKLKLYEYPGFSILTSAGD
jgi:glyoxylase-like metal-dependent hydrolase (beta-lactamase superfamily II)